MLTEKESAWIEKRKLGICSRCNKMGKESCKHKTYETGPCYTCSDFEGPYKLTSLQEDSYEAAIFEANVAKELCFGRKHIVRGACSRWQNGERITSCPPGYDIDRCPGIYFCNMYHARISVESKL